HPLRSFGYASVCADPETRTGCVSSIDLRDARSVVGRTFEKPAGEGPRALSARSRDSVLLATDGEARSTQRQNARLVSAALQRIRFFSGRPGRATGRVEEQRRRQCPRAA